MPNFDPENSHRDTMDPRTDYLRSIARRIAACVIRGRLSATVKRDRTFGSFESRFFVPRPPISTGMGCLPGFLRQLLIVLHL